MARAHPTLFDTRPRTTAQGGSVHIRMVQFQNVLSAVVTNAELGGLSGVIC